MKIHNDFNNKGFTLVEVMVTIVVSGILFAMIGGIMSSFINSYRHSTRLRDLNNEVETIEKYVDTTINYINSNGHSIKLLDDNNILTISFVNQEGYIFKYDRSNKLVNLTLGNASLSLSQIRDIEITYLDTDGIVLRIFTSDNNLFVTYYNVLNINENGES